MNTTTTNAALSWIAECLAEVTPEDLDGITPDKVPEGVTATLALESVPVGLRALWIAGEKLNREGRKEVDALIATQLGGIDEPILRALATLTLMVSDPPRELRALAAKTEALSNLFWIGVREAMNNEPGDVRVDDQWRVWRVESREADEAMLAIAAEPPDFGELIGRQRPLRRRQQHGGQRN